MDFVEYWNLVQKDPWLLSVTNSVYVSVYGALSEAGTNIFDFPDLIAFSLSPKAIEKRIDHVKFVDFKELDLGSCSSREKKTQTVELGSNVADKSVSYEVWFHYEGEEHFVRCLSIEAEEGCTIQQALLGLFGTGPFFGRFIRTVKRPPGRILSVDAIIRVSSESSEFEAPDEVSPLEKLDTALEEEKAGRSMFKTGYDIYLFPPTLDLVEFLDTPKAES